MKKTIITTVLSLLLLLAAAGLAVWLLPVRVTLFIVVVLQLIMLIVIGDIVPNRKNRESHENEHFR